MEVMKVDTRDEAETEVKAKIDIKNVIIHANIPLLGHGLDRGQDQDHVIRNIRIVRRIDGNVTCYVVYLIVIEIVV